MNQTFAPFARRVALLAVCAGSASITGCNGVVGGVPTEFFGGTATASAGLARVILRLSEMMEHPACGTEEPGDVELVIGLNRAGGVDTGDYTVGDGGDGEHRADGRFKLTDKICGVALGHDDPARQGTVVVDEVSVNGLGILASGSYDLKFDGGELQGRFAANGCALDEGHDVDSPDCDDVDHDGEPGGESEGGGGGGGD